MVHHHHQQVLAAVQADGGHAQQRSARQVKGREAQALGFGQGSFAAVRQARGQVDQRQLQGQLRHDALPRQAVGAFLKHRAQSAVALQQHAERLPQGRQIQLAMHPRGLGDVVGRALRVQLPQEPLAQLRMGQGFGLVGRWCADRDGEVRDPVPRPGSFAMPACAGQGPGLQSARRFGAGGHGPSDISQSFEKGIQRIEHLRIRACRACCTRSTRSIRAAMGRQAHQACHVLQHRGAENVLGGQPRSACPCSRASSCTT